jgi:formylmethanofuran dehydrogenase subunit E
MCPGLAVGYRVARAALDHLGADRAEDEELVALVENDSCAVDAVQVLTGCTFGKGNFFFRDYGKHVYTFQVRPSGRGVRISLRPRPAPEEPQPESADREEAKRRRTAEVLEAPEDELLAIERIAEPLPERAALHESRPCAACGQPTMATRLRQVGGRELCIPCADRAAARD